MWRRTLTLVLSLQAGAALAVTGGLELLPTAATDGKTYAAKFAIGLSIDGGKSWQTKANLNQTVRIVGSLDPDPAHVGKSGDIFVVESWNGVLTMLTANGAWLPWSGKVADLQPVRDNVVLAASQDLTIHDGGIATAGQHHLFIGYLPANATALIYSATPSQLQFSAAAADPLSFFEEKIFDDIVLAKCTLCHVAGGVAAASRLQFVKNDALGADNYAIFKDFYADLGNSGYDYVLGKASGSLGHAGGSQLPLGSTVYQNMAAFLDLLDGSGSGVTTNSQALFGGVALQAAPDTLRDAALLFAGRLPNATETAAVAQGGELGLRSVLRTLMSGANFHSFLKDGANDRLHLRGNEDFNIIDDCPYCFPPLNAEYWRLKDIADAGSAADRAVLNAYMSSLNMGAIEAPLELIAYVVENDRPYSEILTADYEMLTPLLNTAVGGTAVFPANAGPLDFRPGRMEGYYVRDAQTRTQNVPGAALPRLLTASKLRISYPHVGILSSKSFLSRYPTTATNRNRARARWTYYNFLGIDIEAQAKRTTDPVALADTNNPTMSNPACIVCHNVLDPLAGVFQDFADNGIYRNALNGTDSLDRFYKSPQTGPGLYKQGDLWYRDMRAPGFEGGTAGGDNVLRWLAEQIVKDRRFAEATVRFWWPAVIGAELLNAPEASEDLDYAAKLSAYEAQQAEIDKLADRFVQGGSKLKDLLADLAQSPWFRAELKSAAVAGTVAAWARELAPVTDEKLLTPEQLARKTRVLTGFNWNAQFSAALQAPLSGLENEYNTFYGGIDGFALKTRARVLTPMMGNVALTHALEASCPVVLGDFTRGEAQRLLFKGLSPWTTPLTEAATTQTLVSANATDFRPLTLTATLAPGSKNIVLGNLNDSCDWSRNAAQCRQNKNLVIDTVSIRRPNGQTTLLNGNAATFGSCAAVTGGNDLTLYSSCTAAYPFSADIAGTYTITASIAAQQSASDPVLAGLNVESTVSPAAANTAGATALRSTLVALHRTLLGHNVNADAPAVQASWDLLVQTWQERRAQNFAPSLFQAALSCDWQSDIGFVATLGYPGNPLNANNRYTADVTTWLGPHAQDPMYMKQSWAVVMAYLLSHYDYLHE